MANRVGLIGSFIVLMALAMGSATEAAEYNVGDNLGWRFPPNETYYSDWANNKTFFVGDKLIFNWTGTHTVGDVSNADYDSCNTNASAFGGSAEGTVFQVNLLHTGPRYFICTVAEHCAGGMKFSINVESVDAAAAPSAPPPSSSASSLSFGILSVVVSTAAAYFFDF